MLELRFTRENLKLVKEKTRLRGIKDSRLEDFEVEEILGGSRPRSSFAPVVIVAGNLMAFEAMQAALGRRSGAGYVGYFVNLWTGRCERPRRGLVARTREWLVRWRLEGWARGAS